MRLVTLQKLTIHTPQGDQSKFFIDDFEAFSYKKISRIQYPVTPEECTALQSGANYCLAAKLTGYGSNANFKLKNTIYTATERDGMIELGSAATTLLSGTTYVYLSEDNQLYIIGERIAVEATRSELQQVKSDFNAAIAAALAPQQQHTLFQFWGQPAQRPATQTAWRPLVMPQPPIPAGDPMDFEKPSAGYDYWGVGK